MEFKWDLKIYKKINFEINFYIQFLLKQKPFLLKTQSIGGNICSITVMHIVNNYEQERIVT